MKQRQLQSLKKVQIVDGRIVDSEEEIDRTHDAFLKELEDFSLDLNAHREHKESSNTPGQTLSQVSDSNPLPEGIEDANPDDFRVIEGILLPKDQPYLPEEYRPELLVRQGEQRFCPYFTEDDISDYGGFMSYLMNTGKGKRTRYDYTIDLRKWKRELGRLGGQLTVDNINTILSQFKAARACRLLAALKSYAEYRNFHQDSKLLILLTTSLTLKKPAKSSNPTRSKNTDAVSREEAKHYRELARDLCQEGRKEGIWIALSLLGVPPGNLAKVSFPDQSHVCFVFRRKERKAKIEKWLYTACHDIDGWRLGRRGVHLGLSKYEITPMALNQHATHHQ